MNGEHPPSLHCSCCTVHTQLLKVGHVSAVLKYVFNTIWQRLNLSIGINNKYKMLNSNSCLCISGKCFLIALSLYVHGTFRNRNKPNFRGHKYRYIYKVFQNFTRTLNLKTSLAFQVQFPKDGNLFDLYHTKISSIVLCLKCIRKN